MMRFHVVCDRALMMWLRKSMKFVKVHPRPASMFGSFPGSATWMRCGAGFVAPGSWMHQRLGFNWPEITSQAVLDSC